MPSSVFWGMQHLNQNLMCAIGMSTTGPDPDTHEIVEICVVPISHMLEPHKELILFNMRMVPQNLAEIDWKHCNLTRKQVAELTVSGIDKDTVAEYLCKWYADMDMPFRKACIPLGFDFPMQRMFLYRWLGHTMYREVFQEDYRDVLAAAHFVNDSYDCRGEPMPFAHQHLRWLSQKLDVQMVIMGGSACGDAYSIIECYRKLLKTR